MLEEVVVLDKPNLDYALLPIVIPPACHTVSLAVKLMLRLHAKWSGDLCSGSVSLAPHIKK